MGAFQDKIDEERRDPWLGPRKDHPGYIGDQVNHPPHYAFSEYEPIKVIRAWGLSFALGNTVKYAVRAGRKDPAKRVEDLKKARFYLDDEIAFWDQSAQREYNEALVKAGTLVARSPSW